MHKYHFHNQIIYFNKLQVFLIYSIIFHHMFQIFQMMIIANYYLAIIKIFLIILIN